MARRHPPPLPATSRPPPPEGTLNLVRDTNTGETFASVLPAATLLATRWRRADTAEQAHDALTNRARRRLTLRTGDLIQFAGGAHLLGPHGQLTDVTAPLGLHLPKGDGQPGEQEQEQ